MWEQGGRGGGRGLSCGRRSPPSIIDRGVKWSVRRGRRRPVSCRGAAWLSHTAGGLQRTQQRTSPDIHPAALGPAAAKSRGRAEAKSRATASRPPLPAGRPGRALPLFSSSPRPVTTGLGRRYTAAPVSTSPSSIGVCARLSLQSCPQVK